MLEPGLPSQSYQVQSHTEIALLAPHLLGSEKKPGPRFTVFTVSFITVGRPQLCGRRLCRPCVAFVATCEPALACLLLRVRSSLPARGLDE